jgi:ribosomal protein S18 acetylase RimI-like enzyme
MLEKYQSSKIVVKEIFDESNQYYLIVKNEVVVGYLGVKLEKQSLYLSKIYLLSKERGSGIGSQSYAFLRAFSKANKRDKITLTVNKNNNNSIDAYHKIGFEITGNACMDIGSGYVMDDYQIELKV